MHGTIQKTEAHRKSKCECRRSHHCKTVSMSFKIDLGVVNNDELELQMDFDVRYDIIPVELIDPAFILFASSATSCSKTTFSKLIIIYYNIFEINVLNNILLRIY